MASPKKRATPRVREHVERFREAGLDTQRYFDALVSLRDDQALPKTHKEALYKLIAMESFIWYLEALRNERVDRMKLRDEAEKIALEHQAAIRKKNEGEQATKLASADLASREPTPQKTPGRTKKAKTGGPDKRPPPAADTKLDRPIARRAPPKKKR